MEEKNTTPKRVKAVLQTEDQVTFLANLYEEMYDPLCCYAYGTLQDHSLTEEAVQETFRIACSKIDGLYASRNPQGWLMNALKNVIRNILRSRARLNQFLIRYQSEIWDQCFVHDDKLNLESLYGDVISEEDLELLSYIILEKRSIQEASEQFGISFEACKKRAQRAKKRIEKRLSNT